MGFLSRLILAAVFYVLTVLLVSTAVHLFPFYTKFSRSVAAFLSGISEPLPFPLWELLFLLLLLLTVYGLFRKKGILRWLSGLALTVSVLVFLFVGLWGANHFAPPIAQRVGLTVTEYSKEQLAATTRYMADQANTWAQRVDRDENGDLSMDFKALSEAAKDGYDDLSQTNSFFRLPERSTVKPLAAAKLFSHLGITGIYIPYTGESCVNPDTYPASIPYTMCHELAHSLTVAPEDEANFCAFLACLHNSDPAFQYSGWYTAYLYTYNALMEADPDAAAEIRNSLSETVLHDVRNASDHYAPYKGKAQSTARQFNDSYLKAFQDEAGIQSYGKVADLLIAWHLQQESL